MQAGSRGEEGRLGLGSVVALGLTFAATVLFRRFLVVSHPFHVSDQTLFLAQFLEASDHLLNGLACTPFNLKHRLCTLSYGPRQIQLPYGIKHCSLLSGKIIVNLENGV